jgi:hypothetical protein
MGSKLKFWYVDPGDQNLWLFKYARKNTGEDWAEKIASEIGALLCLPHARVELATCQQNRGIISLDFTDRRKRGEFVPGNELLVEIDRSYPQKEYYRVSQHTVGNIICAISRDFLIPSVVGFFPASVGQGPSMAGKCLRILRFSAAEPCTGSSKDSTRGIGSLATSS